MAKLVPFSAEDGDDQELRLVAAGWLRLPEVQLDVKELLKYSWARFGDNKAIQALVAEREEHRRRTQ